MTLWASPLGSYIVNILATATTGATSSLYERAKSAQVDRAFAHDLSGLLHDDGVEIESRVLNDWFLSMTKAHWESLTATSERGRSEATQHLRWLSGPALSAESADRAVAIIGLVLISGNGELTSRVRHASLERKLDEVSLGLGFVMEQLLDEIRRQSADAHPGASSNLPAPRESGVPIAKTALPAFSMGCSIGNRAVLIPSAVDGPLEPALVEFEKLLQAFDFTSKKTALLLRLIGQVRNGDFKPDAAPAVHQLFMAATEHAEAEIREVLAPQDRVWFNLGCVIYQLAWGRLLVGIGEPVVTAEGIKPTDPKVFEPGRVGYARILIKDLPPHLTSLCDEVGSWLKQFATDQSADGDEVWNSTNALAQAIHMMLVGLS
jgi:hypothetical protein